MLQGLDTTRAGIEINSNERNRVFLRETLVRKWLSLAQYESLDHFVSEEYQFEDGAPLGPHRNPGRGRVGLSRCGFFQVIVCCGKYAVRFSLALKVLLQITSAFILKQSCSEIFRTAPSMLSGECRTRLDSTWKL